MRSRRRRAEAVVGRRSRAPLRLYVTFFVGWAMASALIVRGAMESPDIEDLRPAWFFAAGTGILVVAVVQRDLVGRRRTDQLLREREALIESIGVVTDPKLSQLPLYQLLDELLDRARLVMRADHAAVLLHDRATGLLEPTATSGLRGGPGPAPVPMQEGVIGRVGLARRGVALTEAPEDRGVVPGTVSLLAVPLVAEGQLVGVLQLGTRERRTFGADEMRVLQLVADRAAVAVDAARLDRQAQRATHTAELARERLELLADAGEVLARPFDRIEALAEGLAAVFVPRFTDWFAFHRLDDGGAPRLVVWQASESVATDAGPGDGWAEVVTLVADSGRPLLVAGEELAASRHRPARRLDLTSMIVLPVLVRSVALGTLTFGTGGRRRTYEDLDVATGQDLAARFAVAVERVLLSAETQQSAIRTAHHAAQLQRLTKGAFAVNASLTTEQLADVLAEQAAEVLDADVATVELRLGEGMCRARTGPAPAPAGAHRATAPLFTGAGGPTSDGELVVLRTGAPFTAEDQAILSSLAQMGSVAAANARLLGDIQESQGRLRALYDASPVAIVELDCEGRGVRWNRAAEAMFGWPEHHEGVVGKVALPAAAGDLADTVLAGDDARDAEVTIGEGADAIAIEIVVVALGEGEDRHRGAVLAAVDVTERKSVAEQLQHAQRMEAMARMAGGIAHDFNNVLMVISGYADLLLRRSLDDDARGHVNAMRDAAVRAAGFTRKLLTISRQQVVQPQVVDVASSLESLQDVLSVMVGSGIEVEVQIDGPPPVLIDPAQFEQLVLNLALNARDAMDGAGRLAIRLEADASRSWAVLAVRDTGQGMDAATLEHCFEPFFTTKDRTKGTGLGLSTVYGVVTQAGGTITAESTLGKGTSFTVRLPGTSQIAEDCGRASDEPAEGLRIIVADDEPDVRAIVADLLELGGHEVWVVADGDAALALVDAEPPDVLLTDIVMPGMRGSDLAVQVLATHPATKVILMSSHFDDEMARDERLVGVRFLGKPFSAEELLRAVRDVTTELPQDSKR